MPIISPPKRTRSKPYSVCPVCGQHNDLPGYPNDPSVCKHLILVFDGDHMMGVNLTPEMTEWFKNSTDGFGHGRSKTPLSDFRKVFDVTNVGGKIRGSFYNFIYQKSV